MVKTSEQEFVISSFLLSLPENLQEEHDIKCLLCLLYLYNVWVCNPKKYAYKLQYTSFSWCYMRCLSFQRQWGRANNTVGKYMSLIIGGGSKNVLGLTCIYSYMVGGIKMCFDNIKKIWVYMHWILLGKNTKCLRIIFHLMKPSL